MWFIDMYYYTWLINYVIGLYRDVWIAAIAWSRTTDCVHASSVNMFKNKIDKYLAKAGYT